MVHLLIHLLLRQKELVEKKLGVVADYCPFCHTARAFRLGRTNKRKQFSHDNKIIGYHIDCSICGARFDTDPLIYEKYEPRNAVKRDIRTLIESTHPQLLQTCSESFAFEEQLATAPDSIPAESRAQRMLKYFQALEPRVQSCYKSNYRFDWLSGSCLVGSLAASLALLIAATSVWERTNLGNQAAMASACVFVAGLFFTLVLVLSGPGRLFRKKLLPCLARGLAPFHPLRAELDALLAKCSHNHWLIGRKTNAARLEMEIAKVPPDPLQGDIAALRPLSHSTPGLQEQIAADNERSLHIVRILRSVEPTLENYFSASTHFDKPATLGCAGTLVMGGAVVAVALMAFPNSPWQDRLLILAGVVFVLGTIYTNLQLHRAPSRFLWKKVLPLLAESLLPFAPTDEEITRALNKCKIAGMTIGKKIKPEELLSALKTGQKEIVR